MDGSTFHSNLRHIDWTGSVFLTAAITLFCAGFNFQSTYGWSSGQFLEQQRWWFPAAPWLHPFLLRRIRQHSRLVSAQTFPIGAFSSHDDAALARIPGVTPAVLGAAGGAMQQAFADGVRVVFMIAAPFGAVACILCLFLPSFKDVMDRKIDAPLEHTKKHHGEKEMT
jgi:hypothetical protein